MVEIENLLNKLINGDTFTILNQFPDLEFIDLTITSPPYNKLTLYPGDIVKAVDYESTSDHLPEPEYQQNQVDILDRIYDISKPGASLFYNHKVRHKDYEIIHPWLWLSRTKWKIKQEIIWDRIISPNIKGHVFYQVDERIYWMYKPPNPPRLEQQYAKFSSIWRHQPEHGVKEHPAPYPLWLPDRILKSMNLIAPSLILDPYMGSGTTALAAVMYGHNYLGIDSSIKYLKFAKQRIDSYLKDPAIFK